MVNFVPLKPYQYTPPIIMDKMKMVKTMTSQSFKDLKQVKFNETPSMSLLT